MTMVKIDRGHYHGGGVELYPICGRFGREARSSRRLDVADEVMGGPSK